MTWPVFVINMAGNTTRMARVAAELDRLGIGFTRIEAVDGRALTPADLSRVYDPQASRQRSRRPLIGPEIGCYLSHISIWDRIAAGDAAGGIVLEDDCAPADDLAEVLAALAADRGGWEITKLYSARVDQALIDPRPLVPGRQIAVPYKVPNTTLGYAIRTDAAARLAARALPVSRQIDEDHKHFWELDLRVALVAPPPLRLSADSTEGGSITASRKRAKPRHAGGVIRHGVHSVLYRLRYLVNLHWARRVRRLR